MKKTFSLYASALLFSLSIAACSSTTKASAATTTKSERVPFARPESISASQLPDGFASTNFSSKVDFSSAKTVSTKEELRSALRKGGVIYVNGMIDMSDGMLPSEGGASNAALDAFVKKHSRFSTYKEYKDAYAAACTTSTDDSSKGPQSSMYTTMHDLNLTYRDVIQVAIRSNTILIGLTSESGFSGATISINGVSNVILRNLTIRDAYDPFPHHEANDGYNAQHDTVAIQGSKNIWVDHCTFADTINVSHVLTAGKNDEKWQTFDGLCDITNGNDNITISYCKFMNHDKTMLIGSSDSESIKPENRHITLHHNYFYNCGQRLPMVRLTTVHTYNNFFEVAKDAPYKSNYALGVRYNALIQSENNYYGSGTGYSFSGNSGSKQGTVYSIGDIDKTTNGKKTGQYKVSKSPLFTIPYTYATITAEEVPDYVKANAGAGMIPVVQ
ncbi:MAG: polysaccharide lyase family 1 protein [Treponema sp.]|uniref:pectate lyase family protein n=1 Tax=Treponema sp. TaxID=166 RepID=UPI0025D4C050|nr:polysaccharide lyase family 1 protein [Treponema sp.]MBQ8678869.1 polysaccharide lyase family 1 protein [Treponema sp.]